MDLRQAAKFFSTDKFDSYDFGTSSWNTSAFTAKIKYATESFTVNDLSSRKRVMFVPPNIDPGQVVRLSASGQIFLVEKGQPSLIRDTAYLQVFNLHEVLSTATVYRSLPVGPSTDPGWAVRTLLENTFFDFTFDRVSLDQKHTVTQHGIYTLYLPSNSQVDQHDTVVANGRNFFDFDSYYEMGLRVVRATDRPDTRIDVVFMSSARSYDPSQSKVVESLSSYNVTAQVEPYLTQEGEAVNVVKDHMRLLVKDDWIGVIPSPDDKVQALGKLYRVKSVSRTISLDQWEIICAL